MPRDKRMPHSPLRACSCHRYSPHILEIKVADTTDVRRAKLYYLRDRKMNRL